MTEDTDQRSTLNIYLKKIKNTLSKLAVLSPKGLPGLVKAFLVGSLYCLYYNTFAGNVRIGFPFLVFAPFKISGPGAVVIGKRCNIMCNVFRGVHLATLSPRAVIHIGERSSLGGVTIRAKNRIIIESNLLAAYSLIQDQMFSYLDGEETDAAGEIHIGKNVWVGGQACVLGGSVLAENDVIALGAVTNGTFRQNCIVSGNPAKRGVPLDLFLRKAPC
jgi:acetyltransferase-like isoleucine patch superfamily enzyme